MTQDEKWLFRYNEVVTFIETNKRNPSKHRIEEHDMLNWLKANRKNLNAGSLKPDRLELFKELLDLIEDNINIRTNINRKNGKTTFIFGK